MNLIIHPDAATAANAVAAMMAQALAAQPRLVLGLATGGTVEPVYARLVERHRQHNLDFSRCRTFNLDEYVGLPAQHRNSYRHFMNERLFLQVNLELANTHLPDGLAPDLSAECVRYERQITAAGGIDLQLLGIGQNGHIGFNEPGAELDSRTHVQTLSATTRAQNSRLFAAPDQMPAQAITMGLGTIRDCRQCLLLATGREKAGIIRQTLTSAPTPAIPATVLHEHPDCTVILDTAAASQLEGLQLPGVALLTNLRK